MRGIRAIGGAVTGAVRHIQGDRQNVVDIVVVCANCPPFVLWRRQATLPPDQLYIFHQEEDVQDHGNA